MCFVRGNIGFTSRRIAHQDRGWGRGGRGGRRGGRGRGHGDRGGGHGGRGGGMKAEEEGVEEGGVETKKAMMEAANLGQKLKLHHQ